MTNIITFRNTGKKTKNTGNKALVDNVVSLAEWRSAERPVRTPSGVFFLTSTLTSPGDAA